MPHTSFSRSTCLFLALLTSCLLASCSLFGTDQAAGQEGVVARETAASIIIENQRAAPIWVDLYTTGFVATALIGPPSFRGDSIPPGGIRSTPLDSVDGIRGTSTGPEGKDIQVLWYEAEFRNGERVPPDDHNSFTIEC
jgi:hypothetical protein